MRIAYMLTSLGIGGAERQVIALAERMQARGHDVVLMVLRPKQSREWPADVETIRLDMTKSPLGVMRGFAKGRGFLRNFKPDIVHSHTFFANIAARMFRVAGVGPRVLSTIHNIYEGGWARMLVYRLSDRLSIHITAVSKAVVDRYCGIGAVSCDKCSVITNGIDTEEFRPRTATGLPGQELLRTEKKFVWLTAGRDVPAKDFDTLLAAFWRVRAEFPQCELWIAGKISESRLKRMEGLQTGPVSYEIDGARWLGVCEDMASLLASVDAFVLSSAWEGMPLALGEAMAMEKPIVATDVGGVRELVGQCGLIVGPKDSGALAEAMLRMMRYSESDRAAMGRSARERICRQFDMGSKVDEWEALYTRLLV